MSVPGVGPVTALAYIAAIENVGRFRRTRDIGAYLLTERRYQSADTDVKMGISKQRLNDEEEVLRFRAFPRPFRNDAGVDRKGERATRWLQGDLRFIHCAAQLVSASVGPDC
jgi:transposase